MVGAALVRARGASGLGGGAPRPAQTDIYSPRGADITDGPGRCRDAAMKTPWLALLCVLMALLALAGAKGAPKGGARAAHDERVAGALDRLKGMDAQTMKDSKFIKKAHKMATERAEEPPADKAARRARALAAASSRGAPPAAVDESGHRVPLVDRPRPRPLPSGPNSHAEQTAKREHAGRPEQPHRGGHRQKPEKDEPRPLTKTQQRIAEAAAKHSKLATEAPAATEAPPVAEPPAATEAPPVAEAPPPTEAPAVAASDAPGAQ